MDEVITLERIEEVREKALEAFWEVVAKSFPQISTGDFPPEEVMRQNEEAQRAIELWVEFNVY
jgi:hypothetical protein